MNNVAYFEIQASNPAEVVNFYKNVFDWNFERQVEIPIEYYRLTDTKESGMLGAILKRPVATPPMEYGTNAYVCSVNVDDFDKTAKLILDNGGQVAMAKFVVPGRCWQGYFIDPDHNTFGVFQVDENAR